MGKHNHKAIITAVVLQQLIGAAWYSPLFFGDIWFSGAGRPIEIIDKGNPFPLMATVVAAILFSYMMSWLLQVLLVEEWLQGLSVGLLVGVGFLAPNLVMHELLLGLPSKVFLIDASKDIVCAGVTGAILSTWRIDRFDEKSEA